MKLLSKHISYERLADYAEKGASLQKPEADGTHLAACAHCSGQLAELEKIMRLMRADQSEGAPAWAFDWATNLFRTRAAAAPDKSLVQKILAVLNVELTPMTPAFGERSAASAELQQRLYQAGANDVDVQITQHEDGWVVSGQVFGPCGENGEVELRGAQASIRAELNNLCEFTLDAVPAGSYTLLLRWPGVEIEVPDLELSA